MSFHPRAIAIIAALLLSHSLHAADGESSSPAAERVIAESTNAALQGDSKRSIEA